MHRSDVTFVSSGARCAAWLYEPDGPGPHPAIVLAHGFAATRHARLDAFAERFAAAGLIALVFDYRHFGDSEGEPRQLLDIGRQLADWTAALAFVRALPQVDHRRLAVWGTSFSGGHVLTLAARDHGLAAAIAQVPFVDGMSSLGSAPPLLTLRFVWAALRDILCGLTGRPPFPVTVVGPPGSFAALNTPDAEAGYRAIVPPGAPWRNEVAARILLAIPRYRPCRTTADIRCPLLVCLADRDALTDPTPAAAAAARAPRAEVRHYPVGHFDLYVGEWFERAVNDQINFLRRHLLGTPGVSDG